MLFDIAVLYLMVGAFFAGRADLSVTIQKRVLVVARVGAAVFWTLFWVPLVILTIISDRKAAAKTKELLAAADRYKQTAAGSSPTSGPRG